MKLVSKANVRSFRVFLGPVKHVFILKLGIKEFLIYLHVVIIVRLAYSFKLLRL